MTRRPLKTLTWVFVLTDTVRRGEKKKKNWFASNGQFIPHMELHTRIDFVVTCVTPPLRFVSSLHTLKLKQIETLHAWVRHTGRSSLELLGPDPRIHRNAWKAAVCHLLGENALSSDEDKHRSPTLLSLPWLHWHDFWRLMDYLVPEGSAHPQILQLVQDVQRAFCCPDTHAGHFGWAGWIQIQKSRHDAVLRGLVPPHPPLKTWMRLPSTLLEIQKLVGFFDSEKHWREDEPEPSVEVRQRWANLVSTLDRPAWHVRAFTVAQHPSLSQELDAHCGGFPLHAWLQRCPSLVWMGGSLCQAVWRGTIAAFGSPLTLWVLRNDVETLHNCLRAIKQSFPTSVLAIRQNVVAVVCAAWTNVLQFVVTDEHLPGEVWSAWPDDCEEAKAYFDGRRLYETPAFRAAGHKRTRPVFRWASCVRTLTFRMRAVRSWDWTFWSASQTRFRLPPCRGPMSETHKSLCLAQTRKYTLAKWPQALVCTAWSQAKEYLPHLVHWVPSTPLSRKHNEGRAAHLQVQPWDGVSAFSPRLLMPLKPLWKRHMTHAQSFTVPLGFSVVGRVHSQNHMGLFVVLQKQDEVVAWLERIYHTICAERAPLSLPNPCHVLEPYTSSVRVVRIETPKDQTTWINGRQPANRFAPTFQETAYVRVRARFSYVWDSQKAHRIFLEALSVKHFSSYAVAKACLGSRLS